MTETTKAKMASFLKEHPRLMGALFALAVLFTQVQPVLAGCSKESCPGP